MADWHDFPWYEQIEPEVRELVWLLRNNGYNTISSCGHERWVTIDISGLGTERLCDLYHLLADNGYRNFALELTIERIEWLGPIPRSLLTLHLLNEQGQQFRRAGESWRRSFGNVDAPI